MGEVLSKLPEKLYAQKQRNVLNALKGKASRKLLAYRPSAQKDTSSRVDMISHP